MDILERLGAATRPLTLGLDAPLAPVEPLRAVLAHLTSTKVHDVYFPFLRFGALHATRTALGWAAMTRARKGKAGTGQDLLGYLGISWGGGTLVSLLLSTPPAWLLSPAPWGIYLAAYFLLVRTGLATALNRLPLALPIALADGLLRGVAVASVPALSHGGSWWTPVLLAPIATCGGSWVASALGFAGSEWNLSTPAVLKGGVLETLDVWGAMLGVIVYSALTRAYEPLNGLGDLIAARLPEDMREMRAVKSVDGEVVSQAVGVSSDTARAVAVLFMAALFVARVLTVYAVGMRDRARPVVRKQTTVTVSKNAPVEVEKLPVEPVSAQSTPKRRKRKGKSKSPAL